MAGTLTNTISFLTVDFKINTPTLRTETLSGKTRRAIMGNQFYTFTAKYPNLTESQSRLLNGFFASQYGGYDSFDVILPKLSYRTATSTFSATPQVSVAASVGSTSVQFSTGVSDANKTLLKSGDFFKFSGHTKVYMAIQDVTTNGFGDGTLVFAGALVNAVNITDTIIYNAVPFKMINTNDVQEFSMGAGGITTLSVDLRETW
jgi:hypothetical protein